MKVFLTGGSGGIGSAIREIFEGNGHIVIAPSSSELNLEKKEFIDSYFENNKIECEIFIHSAGCNNPALIDNISFDNIDKTVQINCQSFIQMMNHILPYMKEKKYGRVVAISSLYGSFGRSGRLAYVASKHALQGVIKTYSCEYGKDNILFNCISPGFVDTKMTRKNNSEDTVKEIISRIPIGRMAMPKEIAETVYYLCSEKNSYITGQNIIVDGGFTAEGGMHSL